MQTISFPAITRRAALILLTFCALSLSCGCARVSVKEHELPPLLSQDELLRPYDKVATIEVTRERYGFPEDLTLEDFSWGYYALREEAAKMGADAVIFPEVRAERQVFTFVPTTELKARGIAIKFH